MGCSADGTAGTPGRCGEDPVPAHRAGCLGRLDVQRLTTDQQDEIRARYGGKEEPGRPPSAADISVTLVLRDDDGAAVGCGALRDLGDGVAEVQRMSVASVARGRGLGKVVLTGLEDAARARAWTTLRLETGPLQPEAAGLYAGAGYRSTGAFGAYGDDPYAADSFFEKDVATA